MKHARLICNQREKFTCTDCNSLTSAGYQLIDEAETRFVCRDCYLKYRSQFPMLGKCLKQLLSHEVVFSPSYDPNFEEAVEEAPVSSGYLGELVSDGNGGWREPTEEEIANRTNVQQNTNVNPIDGFSQIELQYRFTTDNKLQIVVPKTCKIDENSYVLEVVTS